MKKPTSLSMFFAVLIIASLACSLPGQGATDGGTAPAPTATARSAVNDPEKVLVNFFDAFITNNDLMPHLSAEAQVTGVKICNYYGLKTRECYEKFASESFAMNNIPFKSTDKLSSGGTVIIKKSDLVMQIILRIAKEGEVRKLCQEFYVTRVDPTSRWGVNFFSWASVCAS
jgi:hypothetical protein